MKIQITLISILTLLTIGCSSVSKEMCVNTDWQEEGHKDGLKGLPEESILKLSKTCKDKGVKIPIVDYKTGWLKGIAQYCSPEKGFELGLKDSDAEIKNCPVELRTSFSTNYEKGKELNTLNSKIDKFESEIKELENKKASLNNKIKSTRSEISNLENKITDLSSKKDKIRKNANKLSQKKLEYTITK